MRGGVGTLVYFAVVFTGLLSVGLALLITPGRTTEKLHDAFVIVPRIGGRFSVLKRVTAMTVGGALVFYSLFLAYSTFHAGEFLVDPVERG
ncbi:hypothetical protein Pth03_37890 [Planotetraspora thailandica]|uniref:Uncharacterized protein n=1 Tax=Planotetraspora thailandica TaxID=487172 RepID=A0A8J3XWX7_9ACTN|nr:hypothetical protein [Planotetraspora thailandica]GII55400.1 hypothetical protein Pth03_37890 [Planotetraspora thailandica]